MKQADYFALQELIPPSIYAERGNAAWQLLDSRMLATIDQLRKRFGPMFINTWFSQELAETYGHRTQSGLRTPEFWIEQHGESEGVNQYLLSYSQHKYGRAFDALFRDAHATEVRNDIRKFPGRFPYLTAMETGVSWFHGDVRNVRPLMEFSP